MATKRWLTLVAGAVLVACQLTTTTAAPLAIHIHSEHAMFQVLVSPGTAGSDGFVLQLADLWRESGRYDAVMTTEGLFQIEAAP